MSCRQEAPGSTQDTLEKIYLWFGPGAPWDPAGGAGRSGWGEDRLELPNWDAAPATRTRISGRRRDETSLAIKETSFKGMESTLKDVPDPSVAAELEQQKLLFSPPMQPHQGGLMMTAFQNVKEVGFYLEEAGVGLCREEMQMIFLAVRQLVELEELQQCRLWGKILGRESNYIVAEAVYKEADWQEQSTEAEAEEDKGQEDDQLPQAMYKPPPQVPMEPIGTGANKYVYYVCNKPGLPWVKLPPVRPAEITVARQIYKFFTGRLDAPVLSYPPFPGNEANYLRAQIARISAGTRVSPRGFYHLKKEDGDSENEAVNEDDFEINLNYEAIPAHRMVEDLSTWVHCAHYILPQGRCTWVNLDARPEEDEDKEDYKFDIPEMEDGPPILTPLSQDAEMFDIPPWSCRLSSTLIPQHAMAVLRSNLWPGAYAYARGGKHGNIYIGWGLKYAE